MTNPKKRNYARPSNSTTFTSLITRPLQRDSIINSHPVPQQTSPETVWDLTAFQRSQTAIGFLTNMRNLSINQQKIPCTWTTAKIVAILKPNKPEDVSSSCRSISLLSPRITNDISLAPHHTVTSLRFIISTKRS